MDTHTEQALLQNINNILKEKLRTSVFVAHRLRTIFDADLIIVLRDGHVAEQGKHEELLGNNGLYAELWNSKYIVMVYFLYCTNGSVYSTRNVVLRTRKAVMFYYDGHLSMIYSGLSCREIIVYRNKSDTVTSFGKQSNS